MGLFEKLGKDDIYSLMGLLLYASSDNPKYSTLNELAYLLDNQSYVNLLKYFEGQTIQIPTIEETQRALKLLLLYQYNVVEGLDWHESLDKAGFDRSETAVAKAYLRGFKRELERNNYQLGGIKNVFKRSET